MGPCCLLIVTFNNLCCWSKYVQLHWGLWSVCPLVNWNNVGQMVQRCASDVVFNNDVSVTNLQTCLSDERTAAEQSNREFSTTLTRVIWLIWWCRFSAFMNYCSRIPFSNETQVGIVRLCKPQMCSMMFAEMVNATIFARSFCIIYILYISTD